MSHPRGALSATAHPGVTQLPRSRRLAQPTPARPLTASRAILVSA